MKTLIKTIIFAAFIFPLSAQAADYELASGPYTVENLGPLLKSSTQEGRYAAILSNGEKHLFVFYDATGGNSQLVDLNLDSKAATLIDLPGNGRTNMPAALLDNDKFYGALGDGSMNPNAPLIEYNPLTRTSRLAGIISDKGLQSVVRGDDGDLYVGSGVKGVIGHYDPDSDVYEDLGKMDVASTSGYLMVYTIGSDGRYIYAGMRDCDGPSNWYLGVYDRVTKEKRIYFKTDGLGGDLGGNICKLSSGEWIFESYNWQRYLVNPDQYHLYFLLKDGVPTQVPSSYPRQYVQPYDINKVFDTETFATKYNYEFNFDNVWPDNFSNNATYVWKRLGDSDWSSATASGFRITAVRIRRFIEGKNSKMLATTDFYGPLLEYDPANNSAKSLGRPGISVYDLLRDNNDLYISGYAAITERFDLSKPWTFSGTGQNIWDTGINPHQVAGFAKYHYYSAPGTDGKIYFGFMHLREAVEGSGIGWYDPVTGQTGSIDVVSADKVADLKPVLGGLKLVFSTTGDNMYIFDVATKTIERTITPVPGNGLSKFLEVEPGVVLGAYAKKYYKVDVLTGEVIFIKDLPATAYGAEIYNQDQRLDPAPDGYAWLFAGNSLYRINPADGSMQKIIDTTWGRIRFLGADMYLYGDTSLRRIRNILKATNIIYGDVSGDGNVSAYDASLCAQAAVGLLTLTEDQKTKADVTGDSNVSAYDASLIAQKAVGLITKFPVEG
jgi:hypothetical protein